MHLATRTLGKTTCTAHRMVKHLNRWGNSLTKRKACADMFLRASYQRIDRVQIQFMNICYISCHTNAGKPTQVIHLICEACEFIEIMQSRSAVEACG